MLTYAKNEDQTYTLIFRNVNDCTSLFVIFFLLDMDTDEFLRILKKYHNQIDEDKKVIFENEDQIIKCIEELNAIITMNKLLGVK